ncbi:hypothetical protein METHB2_460001 [Candidatus Methylobacter favarea]|uniref:Uncharacterized protein n=1 Tax=Candidatus Methylobacter favarea TaxID=2707345 RepID=A0A8S0WJZ3_9GAMM|nr:hypothetical protein METHB2_460001 [Candidatus Methylobacter favarea]
MPYRFWGLLDSCLAATEGFQLTPELGGTFSPYRRHPDRFGMYELGDPLASK